MEIINATLFLIVASSIVAGMAGLWLSFIKKCNNIESERNENNMKHLTLKNHNTVNMGCPPLTPPPPRIRVKEVDPVKYVFQINTKEIKKDLKDMSIEDMQYLLKHIEDITIIINQEMIEKV